MSDLSTLAVKWLVPLRTSFTLDEHYRFKADCEGVAPKKCDINAFMDEVAVLAQFPQYTQEFIMAKKEMTASAATSAPAAKAKVASATAAPKKTGLVPREPKIAASAKIVWLVKENPKRAGSASHERFSKYFGTKTVEAFLAAGGTRADLSHDIEHEFLTTS